MSKPSHQPSEASEGLPSPQHSPASNGAAHDAGIGDARLGARPYSGGRGGKKDAPPSNTASSKCNSGESGVPFFQYLRSGVDSLYLSYPGILDSDEAAELNRLKSIAQSREAYQQVTAQLQRGGHIFEVKDKGVPLYPFIIEDNAFRLQFSRSKGGGSIGLYQAIQ